MYDLRQARDYDVAYLRRPHNISIWEIYGQRIRRWADVVHGGACHHEDGCSACVSNSAHQCYRHFLRDVLSCGGSDVSRGGTI